MEEKRRGRGFYGAAREGFGCGCLLGAGFVMMAGVLGARGVS